MFAKFPGCLVGPTDDIVIASDTTDYEAELVVVHRRHRPASSPSTTRGTPWPV